VRKDDYVDRYLRSMVRAQRYGVYLIFKSMEEGRTFRCAVPKYPTRDPNHRILAPQRSRFTHYYFYIRDETLGPIVLRVASFFPFQTTYYLNGHSFIEQELNRAGVGFRKTDDAFLAVDDPAALQAAADRLHPALIRERLDYLGRRLCGRYEPVHSTDANMSQSKMLPGEALRNWWFGAGRQVQGVRPLLDRVTASRPFNQVAMCQLRVGCCRPSSIGERPPLC
jgi:hypothetical protein